MAISSAISPEKIVVKNNKTPREARNFISGRFPAGGFSSNFSDSNISEVEQPKVKPVRPDIGGILNSITTNITNNVENYINNLISSTSKSIDFKIKNLRDELYGQFQKLNLSGQVSQITNELEKSVKNISDDYQKKVKGLDEVKPSNFLNKFLGLYKNALEFVQFFSNKKNIDRISNNIDSLEKTFIDSFEVAKLVRKVIINIVKQLSNLPKVSPSGGGGINLDIDVPGSGLRKSAPRGLAKMFSGRGKMLALGAGALGVGAAGVGAVNALQESDLLQPVKDQFGFNLIESLGSIIGRFTEVIDAFVLGSKIQQRGGGRGSSSRSGTSSPSGPGTSPGPISTGPSSYTPGTIPKEVSKDIDFTKGVSELAKKYNVPEDYLYAVMGFETGGTFSPSEKNKAGSGATGLIQFMPETAQKLGTTTDQLAKMTRSQQLKYVEKYFEGTLNQKASLSDVYMSILMPAAVGKPDSTVLFGPGGIFPGAYAQNSGLDLNEDGKVTKAEATKTVEKYLPKTKPSVSPAPGQGGPDLPDFMLPLEKREELARKARNISQPPPSQQAPQVNIMPLDITGGTRQTTSQTSSVVPSPSPQKHGPSVPFISSSNDDNFFVLYSKMVYNIVDG